MKAIAMLRQVNIQCVLLFVLLQPRLYI